MPLWSFGIDVFCVFNPMWLPVMLTESTPFTRIPLSPLPAMMLLLICTFFVVVLTNDIPWPPLPISLGASFDVQIRLLSGMTPSPIKTTMPFAEKELMTNPLMVVESAPTTGRSSSRRCVENQHANRLQGRRAVDRQRLPGVRESGGDVDPSGCSCNRADTEVDYIGVAVLVRFRYRPQRVLIVSHRGARLNPASSVQSTTIGAAALASLGGPERRAGPPRGRIARRRAPLVLIRTDYTDRRSMTQGYRRPLLAQLAAPAGPELYTNAA